MNYHKTNKRLQPMPIDRTSIFFSGEIMLEMMEIRPSVVISLKYYHLKLWMIYLVTSKKVSVFGELESNKPKKSKTTSIGINKHNFTNILEFIIIKLAVKYLYIHLVTFLGQL
jgi:hypothetical protein